MTSAITKSPPGSMFKLVVDQWTQPFWDAARAHRLVVPRCAQCGTFRLPPTPFCPSCQSQAIDWVQLSGRGTVYSYSIVTRAIIPEMEPCLPYITAVVELPDAGGTRLVTNVVGAPVDQVMVGSAVHVVWDELADGVTVPRFKLDDER
jgi:uncharacterized OB-fold protein